MHNKRLFINFLSLLSVQGVNYLLPLITLPYLLRTLGPEKFGIIAFAQALIQYFVLLTDYGFNLTATKEISINRKDKGELSRIFSTVMSIKLALMVISFIILMCILYIVEKFGVNWEIYVLTFGMVLGNVLFPIWFFQGLENMKVISVLNAISKLFFTVSLFIFVKTAEDFYLVPALTSVGYITVGIISLVIIKGKYDLVIVKPKFRDIQKELREGWDIFISTISVSLYTISNTFILGIFTNNTITGYYASAEKLINAINGLINPISQTIFPHLSRIAIDSKVEALRFIRKILKLNIFIFLGISILVFLFSELIVDLVFGPDYRESILVLKILSPLPLLVSISNILGVQVMINFGYKKAFSKILMFSSGINIILAAIFVPLYNHIGTAIALLLIELIVTGTMVIYLKKKKVNLWR
ncbi:MULTISPECIES: flippase [Bacillus cereus group]|uniref:flippase n=1 Tax=Bacillus cereus group TaxID=86661 RepID=UPI0008FE687F|nr:MULTISPECIES: flippase [Bacillus cereus group]MDG1622780.1 flippase [Bacillus mobilis]MDX5838146.1 flippase [Bacillus cereus group sp. BfR-BA-01700]OJE33900.1 transporter [Bacillus mobilis]HDR7240046.1 flippase [Bacillus mobilis]